jgi:peptide/nickel transport system permease protein
MSATTVTAPAAPRPRRRWRPTATMVVAAIFLLAILALVIVVPLLPGYDPYSQDLFSSMAPPGERGEERLYLLGTDALGRDVLSRVALAGQISIAIAFCAVAISLVMGVFLGLVAGFFGGRTEAVIMGLADLQLAIPRVLLLIAVTALLGTSVPMLTLLLGLTSWVSYGRVARAMALTLRSREFVLSAITQGASASWNLRKHLLPNIMAPMLIVASFELGQVITLEASLSYLGLGVQPPLPSWGMMIAEGQGYLELAPWIALVPGVAVFLLIAGVQFLSQSFTAEGEGEIDPATGAPK